MRQLAATLLLMTLLAPRPLLAEDPPRLEPLGWEPTNRAVLERWLAQVALREGRRVAVFDFDNTLIFHDCGEATFRYQLTELQLRVTPEQLGALIPSEICGVKALADGTSLADVRADLLDAYGQLWPWIEKGEQAGVKDSDPARDLRAKLLWFYDAAYETPRIGALYAYPLLARLLAGYTPEEAGALARAGVDMARAEEPAQDSWTSATPGRIGMRTHGFYRGLRAQEEMIELVRALQGVGVEPFVVSASAEPIVEATAKHLGYPFDAEHVFGIRMALDADGRITTTSAADYPLTWRQGKVDLIRQEIKAEPLLVAGDTFTDYEMLVAFAATEVRLLINRNKPVEELEPLYRDGARAGQRAPAPGRPRVVLQGRDEPLGCFRPDLLTIPLGESTPRALVLAEDGD